MGDSHLPMFDAMTSEHERELGHMQMEIARLSGELRNGHAVGSGSLRDQRKTCSDGESASASPAFKLSPRIAPHPPLPHDGEPLAEGQLVAKRLQQHPSSVNSHLYPPSPACSTPRHPLPCQAGSLTPQLARNG